MPAVYDVVLTPVFVGFPIDVDINASDGFLSVVGDWQ
jgi:hypothetical protein